MELSWLQPRDKEKISTCLLSRNSHTPSEANTMNLSSSVILNISISGSQITPAELAMLSPNDLLIASPGMSSSLSQTLYGPN